MRSRGMVLKMMTMMALAESYGLGDDEKIDEEYIKNEYDLIMKKKSKLSRTGRAGIVDVYNKITKEI